MKRSRQTVHYIRTRQAKRGAEGNSFVEYGEAKAFVGEVWPASGKVQAEIYGERLSYVRNVKVNGRYVITTDRDGVVHYVYPDGLDIVESDGVCLYVPAEAEPDYKVLSIKPYEQLRMECLKL